MGFYILLGLSTLLLLWGIARAIRKGRYWQPAVFGFLLGPLVTLPGCVFIELWSAAGTDLMALTFSFLSGAIFGVLSANGKTMPDSFGKRYGFPLHFIWLAAPVFFVFMLLMAFGGWLSLQRLMPDFYLIGLFSGFALRERLRADKVSASWVSWSAFCFVLALPLCHAAYEILEEVNYARQRGHGFEYAGGFSDSDLKPYDPRIPGSIVARLNAPATFVIKGVDELPVLDGAQAAFPVYAAFAGACYSDLPPLGEREMARYDDRDQKKDILSFTNTIRGFERLVEGKVDIFFGARLSPEQMKLAEKQGKELTLTPIGREAFVFFVNEANPVNALTSEQIRRIYSGAVKHWNEVGGENHPVIAFQRPENSGSQTVMRYFMGKTPLTPPLRDRYVGGMGGVMERVSEYRNAPSALGYSFRFFLTGMGAHQAASSRVKMLAIDGISPTAENIASGKYPLVVNLYAVTVKDNPNPNVIPFVQWMTGEQGQELVEKTGYSRLR
ncbi:MAG: substrate-binding domain-containing protein [Zoogloeaceae bacterium]|jgi:phosphate transport system substrate-binding protein|nr:substrate-binding domain-containing protein [Zoogloeaceae bacterium]